MTRVFDVVITYLEQTARPASPPPPPPLRRKIAIMRAEQAPLSFYRYLYHEVGSPHHWVSRKHLNDEALAAIIHHPDLHLLTLYVDGSPAGLAELDARKRGLVELRFFGLAPEFIGKGLGRYFLQHALASAWALSPERVTLETCTLDHPAALPLYQKLGFTVFDRRNGRVKAPAAEGASRP